MNPVAAKPVTITLEGKEYPLFFDLNTFEAFERASGLNFLVFLMEIQQAAASAGIGDKESAAAMTEQQLNQRALAMIKLLSMRHLQALLWASLHTYDKDDNPVWPFSVGQLSRKITVNNFASIIPKVWNAANANLPEASDRPMEGETKAPAPIPEPSTPVSGGETSGPSDADVLALLETRSGG